MRYAFFLLSAVLFCVAASFAADSAAAAPAPITWSGFVDAYYSKNFNSPSTSTNALRNFDVNENQLAFSLAELVIQKTASPVGFRMDLDFGPTNDIVQGVAPYGTTLYNTLSILQQAYLTAVLPVGSGLTVDVGKFVTHMGYEVIESKDNWNYSRSFMFAYAIPYYHTGVRASYTFSSTFSAAVHFVNGWNSYIDNNRSTSLGLMLNYAVTPTTDIIFNGMDGFERPFNTPYGKRDVADFIVTQTVNDMLSLGLNADYGQESLGGNGPLEIWKGAAIYGKCTINPKSSVALRAEVYSDPHLYTLYGYTNPIPFDTKETLKEVTLTYEYHLFDPLITRVEFRDDLSNNPGFFTTASASPSFSATSQPTLLIGVVATF
jgi:Putative beta-barrel porin-2, OmpL-like. bbp2